MKILSLFDGMSCGQIALNKAGIVIEKYYASEIDKYAIQVTQINYPETIQLGDISNWKNWNIEIPDIIMGGSPCQGFSFAGKQFNFEDDRSKLFFIFVDILKYYKSKYFLLENVMMKQEYQDRISDILEVIPIRINSALVSAQNRKRLYWTNIQGIEQPQDRGIVLKDILDDEISYPDREKSLTLTSSYKNNPSIADYEKKRKQLIPIVKQHGKLISKPYKSQCLDANYWKGIDNHGQRTCIQIGEANLKGHDSIKRVYSEDGKSPALTTMGGGHREPKVAINKLQWRKLTPIECERLQTVPDKYTLVPWKNRMMSNSQRYKMLGNGWTVDVIVHILKNIE